MPLYLAKCLICESEEEIYRTFAKYEDLPECCGEKMVRIICPPMVQGDIQPYISMIDGSVISSRSRHREHLKDHECIEVGNEKQESKPTPLKGLKETLIQQVNAKLR